MDPENSSIFNEVSFLGNIVKELSEKCAESTFCQLCPSDQHYFPFRCEPIQKLKGQLILANYPYPGFVLRTSTTDYFLILRNPMNIIASFLNATDQMVTITNAQVVVQYYPAISKRFFPESFHLQFLEVEENAEIIASDKPLSNNIHSNSEINHWLQTILVLHVSSVLSVCGVTICLLFVKFVYENGSNEDMWLILQNETSSWSVALFPGYKYELLLSDSFAKDVFSKHKRPLAVILPLQFRESFEPIFHHPELFSTMDACYIPANTKLKLIPPSVTSLTMKALSVEEALQENTDLISIFGIVTKVSFVLRQWSPSCLICNKTAEEESNDLPLTTSQKYESVINYLKPDPKIPESGIIFPQSRTLKSKGEERTFGAIGCLIMKIFLKDVHGDDEAKVFVRDHFFHTGFEHPNSSSGFLHPGGILPHTVVCFENLIKKTPKEGGQAYYLTTPLTKIIILARPPCEENSQVSWSCLGPPTDLDDWVAGRVFWFPLDMSELLSVKISVTCDCCGNLLSEDICPSGCPNSNYKVDASAVLRIEHVTLPFFKLILKNDNVQTFLGADETLWSSFCTAAKKSPLLYSPESMNRIDSSSEDNFSILFKYYCDLFRPQIRHHVCVKIMKKKEDDCHVVFCLALSRMDVKRTAKFASEANSRCSNN